MIFTVENLINSLAKVLTAGYPDYPVYSSPNQQGTDFPCFFIFLMPSTIESQVDGRFYRDLGIDIVFVQQRNIVNGNTEICGVAEYLDENLELFTYADESGETAPLHTHERQWQTEDQELHYKFHIRQRVSIPGTVIPMKKLEEENVRIKGKNRAEIFDREAFKK